MKDFAAVYTRYRHAVHAYLFTLCQNEDLAEELTQETFFKALRALRSAGGRPSSSRSASASGTARFVRLKTCATAC